MSVFYNENDAKAAAWLRELIALRAIPDGIVDERSILEIQPHEIAHHSECHFFAGIGGWPLAFRLARVPRNDGKRRWTGSCPCQPFSASGKGLGTDDERHLWPAFFGLIRACGPDIIYGEQVASSAVIGSAAKPSKRKPAVALQQVWLDGICADLESAHYACGACDIPAASIGAPHRRQRLYWVAVSDRWERDGLSGGEGRQCNRTTTGREQGDGEPELRCATGTLADSNGGNASAEREQRGGEQRLFAQGDGADAVGHGANGVSSRLEGHTGNGDHGHEPGRLGADSAGSVAASGGAGDGGMGEPDRARSQPGRQAAAPDRHGNSFKPTGDTSERLGDADDRREREIGRVSEGPRIERSGGFWDDFTIIPCRDGKARRIESGTFPLVNGLPKGVVPSGDPSLSELQATAEGRQMRLKGYGNAIVSELAAEFILACDEATRGE